MRTIWKYPCYTEPFEVAMPKGAEIVAFDDQQGQPSFWAIVDSDHPKETRGFVVVGTGHPAPETNEGGHYLGTCKQLDGALMWHLFELLGAPR